MAKELADRRRPRSVPFELMLVFLLSAAGPAAGQPAAGPTPEAGASVSATAAPATNAQSADRRWSLQAQSTFVDQATLRFHSPYRGPNSLDPGERGRETFDATLYAGLRLWPGAEAWINPEIDQGFGLSDTLGAAGFPSGEAYKIGKQAPYVRLQRAFVRQTIGLGGDKDKVDPDLNVFGAETTSDRLVLTVGSFSVVDVFDANAYAHDPRNDFLNWTIVDAGTFDYAANAWGYTYGMAGEWYQGPWTLRLGLFDLSKVPNDERPDDRFTQFETDAELERRYAIGKLKGKVRLTAFLNRGRMGAYADAVRLAETTGEPASVALVREYRSRAGLSLDLEQQATEDLGVFLRAAYAGGHREAYEFTDVDRTVSGGLSLAGKRWGRPEDTFAVAGVVNGVSRDFEAYLNAGGLGILVGDGRLPHPGDEHVLETYYSLAVARFAHVSFDYQFIHDPAYNTDRGSASVIAIRLHLQGNLPGT